MTTASIDISAITTTRRVFAAAGVVALTLSTAASWWSAVPASAQPAPENRPATPAQPLHPDLAAALKRLESSDAATRRDGLTQLNSTRLDLTPALASLIVALEDPADENRILAARALARLEQAALPALDALIRCFSYANVRVARAATVTVSRLGAGAAPALVTCLNSTTDNLRERAAAALSENLAAAKLAIDPLRERLRSDDNPRTRWYAAAALSVGGAAAVPELTKALRDSVARVRWRAAYSLGEIGKPAAIDAIPDLKALRADADSEVRCAALTALRDLGADIWVIADRLEDVDASVRRVVVASFAAYKDPAVIPLLRSRLPKDSDRDVREAIVRALVALAGTTHVDEPLLDALAAALAEDDSAVVRAAAAEALGSFGPKAKSIAPALKSAAEGDESATVRRAATKALNDIQQAGAEK